jgi:HEAT repeat protein
MTRRTWLVAATTMLAMLAASAAAWAAEAPAPSAAVADLLGRVQAQDEAAAQQLGRDLVKLGPDGIRDLARSIVPPGATDDSKARFAMHGLALYAARPDAGDERAMVARALADLLKGDADAAVKAFFIGQLQLVGGPEVIKALAEALLAPDLCDPAARALVSIGGKDAAAALREVLPALKDDAARRLHVVNALGELRDAAAVPALIAAAKGDSDETIRRTALAALGNIGDPAATDTLLAAMKTDDRTLRSLATDAVLTLAQRLEEGGKAADAQRIYRGLWQECTAPADRHIRCAAIRGLAFAGGAAAIKDLAAALEVDDQQVRAAAVESAVTMEADGATAAWVTQLASAPAAGRAEILRILAGRGGEAAAGAVHAALRDKEADVRLAAIEAVASVPGPQAVPAMVAILASEAEAERAAARDTLQRLPGDEPSAAIAAALPVTAPAVKVVLLGVLKARGAAEQSAAVAKALADEDAGVQRAALDALETLGSVAQAPAVAAVLAKTADAGVRGAAEKTLGALVQKASDKAAAVAAVMGPTKDATTSVEAKAALVRVLARAGTPEALTAVRAALKDADAGIQDAAVRSLAAWPDDAAAGDLLTLATAEGRAAHQVLALRGYIRMAKEGGRPDAERLAMLKRAMDAAKRPDEKRLAISALAEVKSVDALAMVAEAMGDEALAQEAAMAAVAIGKAMGDGVCDAGVREKVVAAMTKAAEVSKNDAVKRDAQQVLEKARG